VADITAVEYAASFAVSKTALLRDLTGGSVGDWVLVESRLHRDTQLACQRCRTSIRHFWGQIVVRCDCDRANARVEARRWFGDLVDLPVEAFVAD